MKRPLALLLTSVLALGAVGLPLRAADADPQLAQQALGVLKKSCSSCHSPAGTYPGVNVLDRTALTTKRGSDGNAFVAPGKPEASGVFLQIKSGEMPLRGAKLTPAEVALVKKWIEAGAPFPAPAAPAPAIARAVHDDDMLQAMRNHLATVPASRRRFQRYFSLANIANDPTTGEADLRLYRAALSKVLNSMSWESTIVLPKAIDTQQTLFALDLSDLGWDRRNLWDAILKQYPYGLTHKYNSDVKVKNLAITVATATGTDVPCLRADWFIVNATRPPLYHTLLDLPENVADLEKGLNVDIPAAFEKNEMVRAAFLTSGVSKQNRLIERIPTRYGGYWKSYDFDKKLQQGQGDLLHFPLGPVFKDNAFPKQAFKQAGGEIIWNLPNGLQAYLLVDGKGKRIDEAPVAIVEDPDQTSGSSVIVNGLSCMACHNAGIKRGISQDVLRTRSAVTGEALAKLQKLHPEPQVMEKFYRKDEVRFLVALDKATGSFLRGPGDKGKAVQEFKEPVKEVARRYFGEVSLEEAARELGIDNPQSLKRVIAQSSRLQRLGLAPLADGTALKRDGWEAPLPVQSLFQEAARALGRGTPVVTN
jgi:mono/diheme cytochrome c family protein